MIFSTTDMWHPMMIKFNEFARTNDFLLPFDEYLFFYGQGSTKFRLFYDENQYFCVLCYEVNGNCIEYAAVVFEDHNIKNYFKQLKLLNAVDDFYENIEYSCLVNNHKSLKWCCRFAKNNGYDVYYDYKKWEVKFFRYGR